MLPEAFNRLRTLSYEFKEPKNKLKLTNFNIQENLKCLCMREDSEIDFNFILTLKTGKMLIKNNVGLSLTHYQTFLFNFVLTLPNWYTEVLNMITNIKSCCP